MANWWFLQRQSHIITQLIQEVRAITAWAAMVILPFVQILSSWVYIANPAGSILTVQHSHCHIPITLCSAFLINCKQLVEKDSARTCTSLGNKSSCTRCRLTEGIHPLSGKSYIRERQGNKEELPTAAGPLFMLKKPVLYPTDLFCQT